MLNILFKIVAIFDKTQDAEKGASRNEHGFSMIEILIVLAIMSLIATLVAPRLFDRFDNSKVTAAKIQISQIQAALGSYKLEQGRYPTTEDGLIVLSQGAGAGQDVYMDRIPKDPWGNDYHYVVSSQRGTPYVFSLGRDNRKGGTGIDADIGSLPETLAQ